MKRTFLLCLCTFLLMGCAGNNFSKFYTGMTKEQVLAGPQYVPEPHVKVSRLPNKDAREIVAEMFAEGYHPVGASEWEGPSNNGDSHAIAQAKKIGASCVLWTANYSRTTSGVTPITTYNPGTTSTTHHSGNVSSRRNFVNYRGTTTTHNSGTYETNYVPYSVEKYHYLAVYFAKIKPGKLGVKVADPGDEYKKKFDTNSGALVEGIVKGGGAFNAGILIGDIIMSINDVPYFHNKTDIEWNYDKPNLIKIFRDGEIIEKKFIVNTVSSSKFMFNTMYV